MCRGTVGTGRFSCLEFLEPDCFEGDLFFCEERGEPRDVPVSDAGDDPLVVLVQCDEVVCHVLVAFVDERAFYRWEFFSYFFDVGIEVLLVVFEFVFDAFFADEESRKPGEEESEFFGKRHGFPHADEQGLCVGVDEGDWQLV